MKLQNLVVTKETALKLKTIGFPQDTCFYHHECYLAAGEPKFYTIEDKKNMWYSGASCHKPIAAAPTSAELTKFIPYNLVLCYNEKAPENDCFRIANIAFETKFIETTGSESEVECKAKLIFELFEKKLISF